MATNDTHLSAADLWDLVNLRSEHPESGTDKGTIGSTGASSIIKGTIDKMITPLINKNLPRRCSPLFNSSKYAALSCSFTEITFVSSIQIIP